MKLSCLLIALLLFSSCEGFIRMTGKVVSDNSVKAIEGATIELLDIPPAQYRDSATGKIKDSVFISDSNGSFTVRSQMVGMVFGPPSFRIRVTKEGYTSSEIIVNKKSRKILKSVEDSVPVVKLKNQ